MAHFDRLSGNEAVAVAMRQIDPDVMGAFPITPSTEIPQYFAQYVADGKVHTELVTVESEHSSMSVCMELLLAAEPSARHHPVVWLLCMRCFMLRRPAVFRLCWQ